MQQLISERMENPKKMTLTFLGTGTSTGVPQIGCPCEVCRSADARDKRLRSSVLISYGNTNILIDCGPDFRQQALRAGISHLEAVLITHEHYDHLGGMDDVRPFGDMPVFAEQRVLDTITRNLPYCFGEHIYPGAPRISLHPIEPGQAFQLGALPILPVRVMHAKLPILGFRIGKLGYLTDVKTISDQTIQQMQGLDVLIINGLQQKPHPSHLSIGEAIAIAEKIQAEQTYFTHFSHRIGLHTELEATLPANMYPAYDNLKIEII